MRNYATRNVSSFVLFNDPKLMAKSRQYEIIEEFCRVLTTQPGIDHLVADFVFEGTRLTDAVRDTITGSEFQCIVELRRWVKEISEQCQYRSPKFWHRTSDFVYVNLNNGEAFVFIDAHYWD